MGYNFNMQDAVATIDHLPATYTVIIEWENQLLSGDARAQAMLRRLRKEILAVRSRTGARVGASVLDGATPEAVPEILIAYDPGEVDGDELRRVVARECPPDSSAYVVSWAELPGCRYYEIKNQAALVAQHGLLVFLDSDVIPDEGWLPNLLAGIGNRQDCIVGGFTYVLPTTTLEKAFALGWFFPWELNDGPMREEPSFWANNFAVDRSLFLSHPFPDEPWRTRGACWSLAQQLRAMGFRIYRVQTARTTHPIPNGLRHLISRGMCHGRDSLSAAEAPRSVWSFLRQAAIETKSRVQDGWEAIWRDHRRLNLSPAELAFALVAMTAFNLLYAPGKIWGHFQPRSFNRLFKI